MTSSHCQAAWLLATVHHMSHQYGFRRGDRVKIISGKYAGATGTVDSKVFQYSVDYPKELGASYHVVLDGGKVVTVRTEQVEPVRTNVITNT